MTTKEHAIILRKKGASLRDIAHELGIAKSTTSVWCRDVVLSAKTKKDIRARWLIKTQPGRTVGVLANKNRKLQSIEKAKLEARKILASKTIPRDLLIAGICLYWAEGSKSIKTSTFFVNSDPEMILVIIRFLVDVFGVKSEDFICSIQINKSHHPRINKVLKFWQNLLHLPTSQFRKPTYVSTPHKRRYANHDSYFGIMRLSIRKGRFLQYCMIELVKAFAPAVMSG